MELRTNWSRKRAGWLVAIFLCIECFDEVVDGLSTAAWPVVRTDLALSYTEIGLLFSIPTLIAHIVEPGIGLLGDSWRRFVLIALGGLAYSTACLLFAGSGSFMALLLAMSVMYPASGAFVSLSQSSMVDEHSGREERAMVWWTIAGSVGVAAGPLMFAAALTHGVSWRDCFVALAATAAVLAVMLWIRRPDAEDREHEQTPFGEAASAAWGAVRRPRVLRWLGLLAAIDLLLQTFVGFLALYFVDVVGVGPELGAIAASVWTVAALGGEAGLIVWLRWVDGMKLVRWSAPVVAVLFIALLLVSGPIEKLVFVGLVGLASAGWYSIIVAQYYREFPGQTGVAMTVSSVFGPVQALVPIGVGMLAEAYGLESALWFVVIAPVAVWFGTPRAPSQ